MHHTLIIQCSNYFEYRVLKEQLLSIQSSVPIECMNSTYTFRIPKLTSSEFERVTKYHAPTAKLTKKFTHKGRTTYIKLKD